MTRTLPILVIAITGLLLGQAAYTAWLGDCCEVKEVRWAPDVRWIGPPRPTNQAYFRHSFYIESPPESAWLRTSADNNYELYVNGRLVSRESNPVNHSKGLADGLDSQLEQKVNDARVYRAPIEPMLALWSSPDWKLCIYEDIGKYLVAGRNVIAMSVANSLEEPRLAVEGAVQVTPERVVSLNSGDQDWRVSALAENRGELLWYNPQFPDMHWERAALKGEINEAIYSRLSKAAVTQSPWGRWITASESSAGEVWLKGTWNIEGSFSRALVRTAANSAAAIRINGRLIDDPQISNQSKGRLLIYNASRLLSPGDNEIAVRLTRPIAPAPGAAGGAPMQFYLDAWSEDEQGDVGSRFATDARWTAGEGSAGNAADQPQALELGAHGLLELSLANRGDAGRYDYLALAPYGLGALALGIAFVAGLVVALKRFWLAEEDRGASRVYQAAALLAPAALTIASITLLMHRYRDPDIALVLTDYRGAVIAIVAFLVALVITLFGHWKAGVRAGQPRAGWRLAALAVIAFCAIALARHDRQLLLGAVAALAIGGSAVLVLSERVTGWLMATFARITASPLIAATLLGLIVVGGFILRIDGLALQGLSPDENTSLDVVRGILYTGTPETTSGIWYTRSPVYHYAAAGWLHVAGDTILAAQLFSVFWGTGLLAAGFLLTKQLTGRNDLSLLATAFLALDRWLFIVSRIIRFYVVVEFLTLLCFFLFYKGFVQRGRPAYRYWFFICLTMAILNQEMMITLVPIFLLGFLWFYRPFSWRMDWPLVVAAASVLVIFAFDVFVFQAKCLTPTVALGSTTDSIAKPHLRYVTAFFSGFFLGSSRVHIVLTAFFFLGFVHSIVRRDAWRIFLSGSVLVYLAELTVLLRQISVRYTCPIYPLFVIMAVVGALELAQALGNRLGRAISAPRAMRVSLAGIMLATLMLGEEYSRLVWGRDPQMAKGTTDVTRYIREHRMESDVVMSPAAPAAAVELGGLDYYISSNMLFWDIPYRDGNVIRDRWGGGELVSNPEAFTRVFEKSDRVWIYYDELTESRLNPAMRHYVRTTGRPVMESYAATLRVWDRDRDPMPLVVKEGRNVVSY